MNNFLDIILNIVFPTHCIACGKNDSDLCDSCMSLFPEPGRKSPEWIFPIYDYRHIPVKKAIWLLKYKSKKKFAAIFANVLYGRIIEELSELSIINNFQKPILIPIPLAKKRMRERGYNQTELICKELAKLDKNENFSLENNVLIKTKDGEHQAYIENRQKRMENILNSFSIKNQQIIENRNIVLIDDVITTGATLSEAKRTLRKSGAKKIIAFTIAH